MSIDNIPRYKTLWFEDKDGNEIEVDTSQGMPSFKEYGDVYMRSDCLCIRHGINRCNNIRDAKWPVRLLKWISDRLPDSWHARKSHIMGGETTINCGYTVIKHLVEQRKWSFHDACVAYANMCERCGNLAEWIINGEDLRRHQSYLDSSHTHCMYCKYMDPEYHFKALLRRCYMTLDKKNQLRCEKYHWESETIADIWKSYNKDRSHEV